MNPSISPSVSFLCSSIVQSATSWNFSTTPNHFHALEMATFAFKPQYTYKPTPPRSKSTATRRKPAPEQTSILNKLQHIESSGASLSTPRPAAAAAADDDGATGPELEVCDGDVFGL